MCIHICVHTYTHRHVQKYKERQGNRTQKIQASSSTWESEKGLEQGGHRAFEGLVICFLNWVMGLQVMLPNTAHTYNMHSCLDRLVFRKGGSREGGQERESRRQRAGRQLRPPWVTLNLQTETYTEPLRPCLAGRISLWPPGAV